MAKRQNGICALILTVIKSCFPLLPRLSLVLELNVFKFIRLAAGASYRLTSEIEDGTMGRLDINGWNGRFHFFFQWICGDRGLG